MSRANYKPIGEYIRLVDERNAGLKVKTLLGLSISKQFIPSVANIIGTDMENYKIICKNQFACSTMQVRRDKKMPVALLQKLDKAIISQAYPVFEIINIEVLVASFQSSCLGTLVIPARSWQVHSIKRGFRGVFFALAVIPASEPESIFLLPINHL